MSSLEILDLQGNSLTGLPSDALVGCDHLRVLNLRGNRLARAPNLSRCSVLELLLDGNKIESLASFPDDLGIDSWGDLKRIGLGGNLIKDWGTLKYLAALENLESVDLRRNPMMEGMVFDHRLLLVWLCPLLLQIDECLITDDEFHRASRLFCSNDGAVSDMALLMDSPSSQGQLLDYFVKNIPLSRGEVQNSTPAAVSVKEEHFSAMRSKVKEMSQIVKVLHKFHVNKRKWAVTAIQAWWRGTVMRLQRVPISKRMNFQRFSVYNSRRVVPVVQSAAALPSQTFDSFKQSKQRAEQVEAVIAQSRHDELRLRASFKWHSNPNRLHLTRTIPVPLTPHNLNMVGHIVAIQSIVRGFLVRNRVHQIRARHYASLTIQCAWRGYLVRRERRMDPRGFARGIAVRHVERVMGERFAVLTSQNELLQNALKVLWNESRAAQIYITSVRVRAATKIQALCRGVRARKNYKEIYASFLVYCAEQGLPSRQDLLARDHMACVTIQSVWRGYASRKKAQHLKENATQKREIASLKTQVSGLLQVVNSLSGRFVEMERRLDESRVQDQRANISQDLHEKMERIEQREALHYAEQTKLQQEEARNSEAAQLNTRRREEIERQAKVQQDREAELSARQAAMDLRSQQIAQLGEELRVLQEQHRERTAKASCSPARDDTSLSLDAHNSYHYDPASTLSPARSASHYSESPPPQSNTSAITSTAGFVVRDVRDTHNDAPYTAPYAEAQDPIYSADLEHLDHDAQYEEELEEEEEEEEEVVETKPRSGLHFIGGAKGSTHLSLSSPLATAASTEAGRSGGPSAGTSIASIRTVFRNQEWMRSSDLLPLSQRGVQAVDMRGGVAASMQITNASEIDEGAGDIREMNHGILEDDDDWVEGSDGDEGSDAQDHYNFNDMVVPPARRPPSPPTDLL